MDKRGFLRLTLATGLLMAAPAPAFAADPAADRINAFYEVLLGGMRQAQSLGFSGRYRRLEPAVNQTFDAAAMTRFAVGESWPSIDASTQTALITAFRRLIVSSYAHHFDGYSGERFAIDEPVQARGPDRLVRTRLIEPDGEVRLNYRMRQSGGGWKVIDVYYRGSVSELTTRRAEFASILRSRGAAGLVEHINNLTNRLASTRPFGVQPS
jgi:phospholipid transport system substrate-binding protein